MTSPDPKDAPPAGSGTSAPPAGGDATPPAAPPPPAPPAPKTKEPTVATSSDTRPGRGKLVTFRHDDPIITGSVLEGAGVVIGTADEGGIWIRPLADHSILVDPDNVVAVAADDLGDEPHAPEA